MEAGRPLGATVKACGLRSRCGARRVVGQCLQRRVGFGPVGRRGGQAPLNKLSFSFFPAACSGGEEER